MVGLTIIGHVAIDRVITSRGIRTQLGGPPTYISLVAQRLGLEVDVVTKVGDDMPRNFLKQLALQRIDLHDQILKGTETTRFTLDYRWAERRLSVESVCEKIRPGDIQKIPEAVLISPIVGEVPEQTSKVLMTAPTIALDPQGFVREILKDGNIRPKKWFDKDLLSRVTIYKSSLNELKFITGRIDAKQGLRQISNLGAKIAITTRGSQGAFLMTEERLFCIPAYNAVEVLDPTGAGDAFIGAFLIEYLQGEEAPWCASVGSAAASLIIETIGAKIDVSKQRIMRRAEEIFNNITELKFDV